MYEKYYGSLSLVGSEPTTWHLGRRVSDAVIFQAEGPPQVE
jgi:hypothetical protein